ncbi:hypothetical protein EYF80_067731 [Liparis tanakae]|uniref:Uncharacterized protein n=1 Tax=Liparis tanakae TaxID=230148 RepID=A0A4Z2E063_9TELE|nr:hypothetical protein EYF80_067731 [Liparis tanakae]
MKPAVRFTGTIRQSEGVLRMFKATAAYSNTENIHNGNTDNNQQQMNLMDKAVETGALLSTVCSYNCKGDLAHIQLPDTSYRNASRGHRQRPGAGPVVTVERRLQSEGRDVKITPTK